MTRNVCERCNAPLTPRAARCMRCGTRVDRPDPKTASEAARRRQVLSRYELSEMQQGIVSAAADPSAEIVVVGTDGNTEGEVKSGGQRFYGDEAVIGIAALVAQGLIEPRGEDCFRLTSAGREVAACLLGRPVSAS